MAQARMKDREKQQDARLTEEPTTCGDGVDRRMRQKVPLRLQ